MELLDEPRPDILEEIGPVPNSYPRPMGIVYGYVVIPLEEYLSMQNSPTVPILTPSSGNVLIASYTNASPETSTQNEPVDAVGNKCLIPVPIETSFPELQKMIPGGIYHVRAVPVPCNPAYNGDDGAQEFSRMSIFDPEVEMPHEPQQDGISLEQFGSSPENCDNRFESSPDQRMAASFQRPLLSPFQQQHCSIGNWFHEINGNPFYGPWIPPPTPVPVQEPIFQGYIPQFVQQPNLESTTYYQQLEPPVLPPYPYYPYPAFQQMIWGPPMPIDPVTGEVIYPPNYLTHTQCVQQSNAARAAKARAAKARPAKARAYRENRKASIGRAEAALEGVFGAGSEGDVGDNAEEEEEAVQQVEQDGKKTKPTLQFHVEDTPGKIIRGFPRQSKPSSNKSNQKTLHCPFCQSNGETPDFYSSHMLKTRTGKVICPVLRNWVCPDCNATGDEAHTRRYCPTRTDAEGEQGVAYGQLYKFCHDSSGNKQLVKF